VRRREGKSLRWGKYSNPESEASISETIINLRKEESVSGRGVDDRPILHLFFRGGGRAGGRYFLTWSDTIRGSFSGLKRSHI